MRRLSTTSLALTIAATGLLVGGTAAVAQDKDPADFKIGVVTDVGTVDDKNFNEFTFEGANQGAAALGVATPVPVAVPGDASEYGVLLQAYIDNGFDIVVSAGFNLGVETTNAAQENPGVWFIGVDQGPPCVNEEGRSDTTFTCAGNAAELLPNYIALSYQEDQAGYLAGIVAASVDGVEEIGAIGGISLCGPCIRYIQGFTLGAQSVNPDIKVVNTFLTDSDFVLAFNDPVAGKEFAQAFIQANPDLDVLFQVAGKSGNGMVEAACEAGLLGIGVDVDQALSHPPIAECALTSATKALELAVSDNIKKIADGTAVGGDDHWDAARDGVGIAPFHENADMVPDGVPALVEEAFAAMQAGELVTCPEDCGQVGSLG